MDSQYTFASKEDIWRLQSDLKSVYAVQAEHADRLLRLERRYDDDTRTKSVWGPAPTFSSLRGGTPHQGYNPAAEAFKNFDQDNSASLLGSLQIDADDEPRRGTSRANSVRFDESALHGQLSHTSRSSSEFFPLRTGSAFGSVPLTERSSSHKSEGRQSSTGLSTHSTGLNGLGFDPQPQGALIELAPRPAPGLLLLGPHPSIIRCWLGSRFTNDTLRYVALNTGASRSSIARSWLQELSLQDQIYREDQHPKIKLQISLPEAVVQQPSVGPNITTTELPTITVILAVIDALPEERTIQCFLGSDVLRARNADILFSQDRLTLFDDHDNKLNVPLVRPEHASTYEHLRTTNGGSSLEWRSQANHAAENKVGPETGDIASPMTASRQSKAAYSRLDWSRVRQGRPGSPTGSGHTSPRVRDSDSDAAGNARREQSAPFQPKNGGDLDVAVTSPNPDTPLQSDHPESWASWRKEPAGRGSQKEPTFSSVASSAGQRSSSQGKGMKVLKSRRMSSNRSLSTAETTHPEPSPSMWGTMSPLDTSTTLDSATGQPPDLQRRSYSSDLKTAFVSGTNGTRAANPIGGASAFGWLNPSQSR